MLSNTHIHPQSIFSPIHPGISQNIVLNNRCFVFKLKLREALGGVSAGNDALFIFGLGNNGAIKGVKDLEEQTGLKAVALLCNGGGHHIYVKNWYDAFPAPFEVWVSPTKVPGTSNGQRLQEDYPDRWILADNSTTEHHVHQLRKYFGSGDNLQVDCVLFNQLYGYSDKTSGESGCHQSPEAEVKANGFKKVFSTLTALGGDQSTPTDDTVFYHKPTGLLITGHHWEFCYYPKGFDVPKENRFAGGWLFESFLFGQYFKTDRYDTSLGTHINRLRDVTAHAKQWQEVLKWDFKWACSHHDFVTVCGPCSPIPNKAVLDHEGGVKGWMEEKLTKSGELTGEPTYSKMMIFGNTNALGKVVKQSEKFQKKLGEPPLPMGGPSYDGMGHPVQIAQ